MQRKFYEEWFQKSFMRYDNRLNKNGSYVEQKLKVGYKETKNESLLSTICFVIDLLQNIPYFKNSPYMLHIYIYLNSE